MSNAQNAGESAMCPARGQPSAEIVRVDCAKCRRQCDESHVRTYVGSWKMRTGDLLVQATVVGGVAGELEAENWRLCTKL